MDLFLVWACSRRNTCGYDSAGTLAAEVAEPVRSSLCLAFLCLPYAPVPVLARVMFVYA